jgi:non-homologous end joining protein Ku/Zn-dependent peptidase ImmA (M78 family)
MNLQELDSYNLADAVKFNKTLNPRLWQKEQMHPEVRDKLLEIAADFKEFLGLSDLEVKDITVSGSNAGYTYTPYSDIDLHLVVDIPKADSDDVYRELFDAKKYQYNDLHNIKIGGYDVELYVENANKPPVSQGVFSVLNNDWINIPRYRKSTVDDDAVRSKYEDFKHRIDDAVKSNNMERIDSLARKIKTYRQAGLDAHGELGPENLAYKMLRTQGFIKKLYDARAAAKDAELSLNERKKKKKNKRVKYGFSRTWGPVFDFGDGSEGGDGGMAEDATATPDGVNPTTQMFLNEKEVPTQEEIIRDFLNFVVEKLNIDQVPKLRLKKDPAWSIRNHSFGRYDNATGELIVALGNRHIMDVLRTLAHELTHRKQDERETMPADAGETGSSYENEANAQAGVLMRDYAELHPEYFQDVAVAESASGYIPTKAQAKDPRYAMALTVDIKPGQVGKEANKMALKTNKQGKPGLLIKSANMIGEATKTKSYGYNSTPLSQVPGKREDELGNQEATGPEFEPQFPAGTTKVDVTDLTDWYRLGMDISDMDDADPEDYNQGPPQTVIVFPSDEAEQGYLKQFKRLGLKTHDLDPDVEGGEDTTGKHLQKALAEEYQALKEQDLFEVKMTSKNLAKLAKDIPGVKVGLEFEMIVPNVTNDDSGDMEPDYDQDERVRDIDDAVSFFDDGDYNYGSVLRRTREEMESNFFDWQIEQIDEAWDQQGFEFLKEYLDREEPFDPEDYEDRAEEEVKDVYPDLDPTSEEFEELKSQKLKDIEAEYYNETWETQGRSYDRAREEFDEEQRDNFSEQDWLESLGIRYASDVQNEYTDLTWPYWRSTSSEDETDAKEVALNFMNYMGYDTIAVGDYHGYGGGYKKWVGNGWVSIGSNKPDDCFTVEPDGSLQADDASDTGLEFVSPPIPLDQIGETMKKVQQWAGENGVYTGKSNATSMHTNISIPGYDLDKLDYLKAALLLGDEHVLRQFDRIGNTYAKPAIEKVKQLVKQKPEKAQELLDKMKSQLNAEASKMIHSGQTDKYTSINTKDNRVEFRSPGGDYLSDIADNPQKMIDTINRMVVTLDAAMDPNKYKEEYQKKLYKVLTGQGGGREAATGKKQEMKANDKDLLNIFSRYAAGELPKQALKSFVRQAQLQRKVAKGETSGKMWWNVKYNGQRIEVVADSEMQAKQVAAKEWGLTGVINSAEMTAEPLRPYVGAKGPTLNGRPSNPDGDWVITNSQEPSKPVYRYMASDNTDAYNVLQQWIAANPGTEWKFARDSTQRLGQPGESQSAPSTTDAIRQAVGRNIEAQSAQNQGNWGIWMQNADRFANQPGEYSRGAAVPLYRFPSREAAEQWIEQQRAERPNMRTDIEVREIEPAAPIPGSTLDLQRQRAAQQGVDTRVDYELYNRDTGDVIDTFQARNDDEARVRLDDFRNFSVQARQNPDLSVGVRRGPGVTNAQTTNNLRPTGPGPWELASVNNNQVYFNPEHTNRGAAETEARTWIQRMGLDPAEFVVRTREGVGRTDAEQGGLIDVAGDDWDADFERSMQQFAQASQAPQTLTRPGQSQQVFTGNWNVLINGEEVYQFGGIGNNQSDANRVGRDWILQQIRQGTLNPGNGADIEVVPVMA